MLPAHDVIVKPLTTEKSTALEAEKVYTFVVNVNASKHDIRAAVERAFQVTVEDVRTTIVRGHIKRTVRGTIRQPNWKKAYVRISKDHTIDFLERK